MSLPDQPSSLSEYKRITIQLQGRVADLKAQLAEAKEVLEFIATHICENRTDPSGPTSDDIWRDRAERIFKARALLEKWAKQ